MEKYIEGIIVNVQKATQESYPLDKFLSSKYYKPLSKVEHK